VIGRGCRPDPPVRLIAVEVATGVRPAGERLHGGRLGHLRVEQGAIGTRTDPSRPVDTGSSRSGAMSTSAGRPSGPTRRGCTLCRRDLRVLLGPRPSARRAAPVLRAGPSGRGHSPTPWCSVGSAVKLAGVTRSPGHPVTRSPGHPVTRSPGHPVTRSPGHPVTRTPGAPGYPVTPVTPVSPVSPVIGRTRAVGASGRWGHPGGGGTRAVGAPGRWGHPGHRADPGGGGNPAHEPP
jgi:hypothetical protein